jgi:hypothetical protein
MGHHLSLKRATTQTNHSHTRNSRLLIADSNMAVLALSRISLASAATASKLSLRRRAGYKPIKEIRDRNSGGRRVVKPADEVPTVVNRARGDVETVPEDRSHDAPSDRWLVL